MKCPRCQIELRRSQYNGDSVYQCSKCAGYLVERKDLTLIELSATAVTDDDDTTHEHFVPSEVLRNVSAKKQHDKIRCPRCHSDMVTRSVTGDSASDASIELDECKLCHAFWFDASELAAAQGMERAVRESVAELKRSLLLSNTPESESIKANENAKISPSEQNQRELGDIVLMVGMIAASLLALFFKMFRFEFYGLNVLAGLAFVAVTVLAVTTTWRFLSSSSQQTTFAVLIGILGSILAVLICIW